MKLSRRLSSLLAISCRRLQQNSTNNAEDELPPDTNIEAPIKSQLPVVQLPARNLWCNQFPIPLREIRTPEFMKMLAKLQKTREFYQYPSMCAPQIGWNVRCFVLSDGTVWVNPEIVSKGKQNCWCWEPCASCSFFMHYIERPHSIRIKGYNERGMEVDTHLSGMKARFCQHELDHLDGQLFTRKVPNTDHIIPLDAFNSMSDWEDDFPSIEARSTFLYHIFIPPHSFISDPMPDAALLDRKFQDNIYPGFEADMQYREAELRHEDELRHTFKAMKKEAEEMKEKQKETIEEDPDLP